MFELTNEHRMQLLSIAAIGEGLILSHAISHQFVVKLNILIEQKYISHTKKRDVQIFALTEQGWNTVLRFAGPRKKSALYRELKHMKRMHIG